MAAPKINRVQKLTDPDTNSLLQVEQTIISASGSLTLNYAETLVVGGKKFPQPNKNESTTFNVQINSVEDLEKLLADAKSFSESVQEVIDKMGTPYKGTPKAAEVAK